MHGHNWKVRVVIEGEKLDSDQVKSSIARRLGMDVGGLVPADRDVEGVVEMMLDATRHFAKPLTKNRLFDWHASLFPTAVHVNPMMTIIAFAKQVAAGIANATPA